MGIFLPKLLPDKCYNPASAGLREGAEVYLEVNLFAHLAPQGLVMFQYDLTGGEMTGLRPDFLVTKLSFAPDSDGFTG